MSRILTINYTTNPPAIDSYAGELGENNAVTLKVFPETENTNIATYVMNFAVEGGILPSATFAVADELEINLSSALTQQEILACQLIGLSEDGKSVISKTPIVKLILGESLTGEVIDDPETGSTIYEEIAALQKIAEDLDMTQYYKKTETYSNTVIDTKLEDKQDILTSANAGSNITITEESGIVKINSTGEGSVVEIGSSEEKNICKYTLKELLDFADNGAVFSLYNNPLNLVSANRLAFKASYINNKVVHLIALYQDYSGIFDTELFTLVDPSTLQVKLENQKNIKSFNGESLLGEGDITTSSSPIEMATDDTTELIENVESLYEQYSTGKKLTFWGYPVLDFIQSNPTIYTWTYIDVEYKTDGTVDTITIKSAYATQKTKTFVESISTSDLIAVSEINDDSADKIPTCAAVEDYVSTHSGTSAPVEMCLGETALDGLIKNADELYADYVSGKSLTWIGQPVVDFCKTVDSEGSDVYVWTFITETFQTENSGEIDTMSYGTAYGWAEMDIANESYSSADFMSIFTENSAVSEITEETTTAIPNCTAVKEYVAEQIGNVLETSFGGEG